MCVRVRACGVCVVCVCVSTCITVAVVCRFAPGESRVATLRGGAALVTLTHWMLGPNG